MLFKSPLEVIGNTPVIELEKKLFAKMEFLNPTGSIKDRAAYYMIKAAVNKGILKKDSIIIEPTSGNMGISLSFLGAVMGFRVIICMPSNMSNERINILKLFNARVILTDAKLGIRGSVLAAEGLCSRIPNLVMLDQFSNDNNYLAHYDTTGREILNDVKDIKYLVAGIGTGGTISGIGKYLKENTTCKIIGIEPESSPFLTTGNVGVHQIQGIGAGFKPKILKMEFIDEIVTVSDCDAYTGMKSLIKNYGIMAGISSGACYKVGYDIHLKNPNDKIVIILADGTNRYLSNIFEE